MSSRTKQQHFVPSLHLARRETPQERTGNMWVLDRTNDTSWLSTPECLRFAGDFYASGPREAPQVVENLVAKLAGIGSETIGETTTTDALATTSEGLHCFMSPVAMLAALTSRIIEQRPPKESAWRR